MPYEGFAYGFLKPRTNSCQVQVLVIAMKSFNLTHKIKWWPELVKVQN